MPVAGVECFQLSSDPHAVQVVLVVDVGKAWRNLEDLHVLQARAAAETHTQQPEVASQDQLDQNRAAVGKT